MYCKQKTNQMEQLNIGIYQNGEFAGVDNEAACDLVERAVQYGVKQWGKSDVMAIQIGAYWLEGYLSACCDDENVKRVLRNSIKHYFFI